MQMVMAVFAYIYLQSFVVSQSLSVETILDQVLCLFCYIYYSVLLFNIYIKVLYAYVATAGRFRY